VIGVKQHDPDLEFQIIDADAIDALTPESRRGSNASTAIP